MLGERDTETDAVEARVVLAPVVRRLSERDRKVLQLRFFDDRTQREIAEEIGVTQTQVSRVLTRIMSELRETVEEPGDQDPTGRVSGGPHPRGRRLRAAEPGPDGRSRRAAHPADDRRTGGRRGPGL